MDNVDLPVTLVVKTPNQSVKDMKIDCSLKWSVHQLKQHISQMYPGKPQMSEQKLIYAGRLLQGPEVLKDILKHTYDEAQTTHTVHLLCMSQFTESSPSAKQPSPSPQSSTSQSSSPAAHTNQSSHSTDGLRHRHTHTSQHETHTSHHQNYAHYYGAAMGLQHSSTEAGTMPAMLPGMHYSPEQMMWFQQMYTQQMAHYMQYMQQGYGGAEAATSSAANMAAAAHAHLPHPAQVGAAVPPAAGVAAVGNRGGDQQQMVMNAAGGQAMFDDEDEGNRDWLDLSYTMCRFGVLLMIVYFYSSISRFLMVFGFFVIIWFYQAGYFRIARRNNERQAEEQANRQEDQQQQENNENLPVIEEEVEADNTERAENESDNEATMSDNTENVPPPPGVARVALSFFVTFFTSLIPAHPDAVNAN